MNNIDPQLLAQIIQANGLDVGGYQLGRGNAIYDPLAGIDGPQRFEQAIYGNTTKDGWTTNGWDAWDVDGKYRGHGTGDSDALSTLKFLATAAAGYFGGNALAESGLGSSLSSAAGGAGGAGAGSAASNAALMEAMGGTSAFTGGGAGTLAGGAGAGTMANGAFLGEGAASGIGAWDAAAVNSALGSGQLGTAASYLGQNAANGTLGSTLGNMAGGAGSAVANAAKGAAGSGLNAGSLLGAVAGALDGGDKQQTSSRDPWAPAQPFLKQQLDQGQALATQYQQQPFSQAQQTAYGNLGGLLDTINRNAGGLLSGFNAAASGANNYDRANPRRQLTGGQALGQMDLSAYAPGLLGNFGTTRKG